jgi:hypothetical protein
MLKPLPFRMPKSWNAAPDFAGICACTFVYPFHTPPQLTEFSENTIFNHSFADFA